MNQKNWKSREWSSGHYVYKANAHRLRQNVNHILVKLAKGRLTPKRAKAEMKRYTMDLALYYDRYWQFTRRNDDLRNTVHNYVHVVNQKNRRINQLKEQLNQ